MVDYMRRLINIYLLTVLLAGSVATWLRFEGLVTGGEWVEVIRAALTLFVGGGFLREGLTAFATGQNKTGESTS